MFHVCFGKSYCSNIGTINQFSSNPHHDITDPRELTLQQTVTVGGLAHEDQWCHDAHGYFNHPDSCVLSSTTTKWTRKAERDDDKGGKDEETKWPAPSEDQHLMIHFFFFMQDSENLCKVIYIWFYTVIEIKIHPVSEGLGLKTFLLCLTNLVKNIPE